MLSSDEKNAIDVNDEYSVQTLMKWELTNEPNKSKPFNLVPSPWAIHSIHHLNEISHHYFYVDTCYFVIILNTSFNKLQL